MHFFSFLDFEMLNMGRCAENATGEAIVNSVLQAESSNTVLQVDMGGDEGQCGQVLCWAIQPGLQLSRERSNCKFQLRLAEASWGAGSVVFRTKG